MGVERLRQSSFAKGEFAPGMWGRVDYQGYGSGARTLFNCIVTPHGASSTRPGFRYLFTGIGKTVLLPFVYSDEDVVVLEFTAGSIRFYRLGTGFVESSPGVPLVVATTYLGAELDRIRWAQVGDVVTLVHPAHPPAELTRTSQTTWTLADIDERPTVATPTKLRFKGGGVLQNSPDSAHPTKEWSWMVTAVNADGEESLPSFVLRPPATSSAGTSRKAVLFSDYPVSLEWSQEDSAVAYNVYRGRAGVFGWVGQAREEFSSGGTSYITFRDDGDKPDYSQKPPSGRPSFSMPAWSALTYVREGERYTNGGNVYEVTRAGTTAASGGPTGTGSAIVDGATAAYQTSHVYGSGDFIVNEGETFEATIGGTSGTGIGPYSVYYATTVDNTVTWTWRGHGSAATWKWVSAAPAPLRYPSTVCFHEGRRIFGNTQEAPDLIQASRVDHYATFDEYMQEPADGALSLSVASRRYEEVRSLVSRRFLLALTSGSEWAVQGSGQGETLAPGQVAAHPGSEHGSAWVAALPVGDDVLMVQRKGSRPLALVSSPEGERFGSMDLSTLSSHLFDGKQIVRWAYAEDPWSVVWAVLDDGTLLSLTWNREQEMAAWCRHELAPSFDGFPAFVEDVCTVPDGDVDAVLVVVSRARDIYSASVRTIERLTPRETKDVAQSMCLDSGITLDGSGLFVAGVGTTLTGLDHLEGWAVHVLVDGRVGGPYTVNAGSIVLPETDFPEGGTVIHVGLRYDCDLGLLAVPHGKHGVKVVRRVWLEVEGSVGLFVGPDESHLKEWAQMRTGHLGGPVPLETTEAEVLIPGAWGKEGTILIRQSYPLPLTVLSVTREVLSEGSP